jgi:hypothetical protein
MKTQTVAKKYSMLLFSALASLMLMTAACQKSGGGSNANNVPVAPIYPGACPVQPCAGQVPLYGGTTINGTYFQVQFQVTGDQTGNGYGMITGQVNATGNFLCQIGQPIIGSYTLQGQGQMINDVFQGNISLMPLTGGTIPMNAYVTIVPSRIQGAGLFSLQLPCFTSQHDMNF